MRDQLRQTALLLVQVLCPEFASNTLFLGGDVGEDAFLSLHNNPSLANSQQAGSFLLTPSRVN